MNIPRYWSKGSYSAQNPRGKQFTFTCWRGSDVSQDDAHQQAQDAAQRVALKLAAGQPLDRYGYGARALREEIIQPIKAANGKEIALISRNSYGALVLNAARVMFVDIDFPKKKTSTLVGWLIRSLQKPSVTQEEQSLAQIETWAARNPGLDMRVYRTYGGLRCLVTSNVFDPIEATTLNMMRELGCDPLYLNLCKDQQCFRARLTPKPWRCSIKRPTWRYPWENSQIEQLYRLWEARYQLSAEKYTVCRLVKEIGHGRTHPEAAQVMAEHDRIALGRSELALA
jgi:hypothetical protein